MGLRKATTVSVLDAAEKRIVNDFNKNEFVVLSFSGGKDSIVLSDVTVRTMQKYNIPFSRLIVIFFDEEAIYPDVEQITLQWRSNFLGLGAKFYWFCLPIKHFNCCNRLENDETFICWQKGKENVWVRPMPKFAIRGHKAFKDGWSYQQFASAMFHRKGMVQSVGLRVAESVQRLSALASTKSKNDKNFSYPLYDWKDADIWLYCKLFDIELPQTYIYLYKTGVALNRLRISQFFSIDTIKSLPKLLEFYPDLYERIVRREPNADLVMLYHETSMFRSTKQDTDFADDTKDYKVIFESEMKKASLHPSDYAGYKHCKQLLSKSGGVKIEQRVYKQLYGLLIAGDPKNRTVRSLLGAMKKGDEITER